MSQEQTYIESDVKGNTDNIMWWWQQYVVLCVFGATVASAPPPRLLELQDGVEAGPEPQPRRSTKIDSKYLHKQIVQNFKKWNHNLNMSL